MVPIHRYCWDVFGYVRPALCIVYQFLNRLSYLDDPLSSFRPVCTAPSPRSLSSGQYALLVRAVHSTAYWNIMPPYPIQARGLTLGGLATSILEPHCLVGDSGGLHCQMSQCEDSWSKGLGVQREALVLPDVTVSEPESTLCATAYTAGSKTHATDP